jgi:phosphoglycolate phosphatase
MKYGIIFDLDGTLLDTLEDLADSVNYALEQHGYPQRTLEEIRTFVGNGAAMLIKLATSESEDYEQVLRTFQRWPA